MKNNAIIIVLCFMTGIALASWLLGIYGQPVTNLLSVEGLRWFLRHAADNISASPIGDILILLIGAGIPTYTGLFRLVAILHRPPGKEEVRSLTAILTLRQRRAFTYAVISFVIYLIIIGILLGGDEGILLGITGNLSHSPFLEGLPLLISIGMALPGTIYGVWAGKFLRASMWGEGLSYLVCRLAPSIVLLMFTCQLFALLDFTGFSTLLGIPRESLLRQSVEWIVYLLPFVFQLFSHSDTSN